MMMPPAVFVSSSTQDKANEMEGAIYFADTGDYESYQTDLRGDYQQKNLKTCLKAINVLQEKEWEISDDAIKNGLLSVVKNTELLGRWQILGEDPLIICDTGHNREGIREIVNQLDKTHYNNLHIVFGTVNDKSIDGVLELLPKEARYYFCEANIPRALEVNELSEMAQRKGLKGEIYDSVPAALKSAKENVLMDDLIFIGGSTFVVAEVL